MNKEIEEKIIKQRENYIYKILLIISIRGFFEKYLMIIIILMFFSLIIIL